MGIIPCHYVFIYIFFSEIFGKDFIETIPREKDTQLICVQLEEFLQSAPIHVYTTEGKG